MTSRPQSPSPDGMNDSIGASGRAGRASPEPASGLGHSATIPDAGERYYYDAEGFAITLGYERHGPVSPLLAENEHLRELLATHPPYAADTTFAEIWQWLAKKDAALAKARGQ